MGESIVAPPVVEDKMKGSLNNKGSDLEVSVSFGRFESDSLSWEKWSTFSPNKYLDEVEKCATPGSVAQKKAYFEAHYKKIAARKLEEIEEEKQKEAEISNKYDQVGEDHIEKSYEYDNQAENVNVFQKNSNFDESNESSVITVNSQCSTVDEIVDCRNSMIDGKNKELSKVEETQANVAKKKAYLEAHYKKIATKKAEEMEEKPKVVNFSNNHDQNDEAHVEKPCAYDDQAKNIHSFQNHSNCDESNESSTITIDSQCSVIDEIVDSRSSVVDITNKELGKVEESQVIKVQEKIELQQVISEECVHSNESRDNVESIKKFEKKIEKTTVKAKGKMNLDASKKSPKMAHSDKEKSLAATSKKLVQRLPKKVTEISTQKTPKPVSVSSSAAPRSSMNYLPKASKPIFSSSLATASSSSTKKTNSSPLPWSKTAAETKKIAPSNGDSPSLPTNRSSLIMEKMADKDIVRRAFKSFQKNFNQGGVPLRPHSSGHNEVSTSGANRKVAGALPLQRGLGRGVGKMDVQRAQLGRSLNSTLGGSLKGVSMDQRHAKPAPSSSSIKSDERQKHISKKLVEQSSAKEAERAHLGSNSKVKEAKIKNLRQNLNFKATPMPSFYRGHTSSKLVQ